MAGPLNQMNKNVYIVQLQLFLEKHAKEMALFTAEKLHTHQSFTVHSRQWMVGNDR